MFGFTNVVSLLILACSFNFNSFVNAKQSFFRNRRSRRARRSIISIKGHCQDGNVAVPGDSCGVPDFVDVNTFGDNMNTTGWLLAKPWRSGKEMKLNILLTNLPKPNLVLTAWLVWVPSGQQGPPIFEVARGSSPCAPFNAGFTSGIGKDPNEFRYISRDSAILKVNLNFNPTRPNQGPLTRKTSHVQMDVPGIQNTNLRQPATRDGSFVPTSSTYLRRFDPKTGFERLGRNGEPLIVRSPVKAASVVVIAHLDKTTHGISPGIGGVDHYFIMSFPFDN